MFYLEILTTHERVYTPMCPQCPWLGLGLWMTHASGFPQCFLRPHLTYQPDPYLPPQSSAFSIFSPFHQALLFQFTPAGFLGFLSLCAHPWCQQHLLCGHATCAVAQDPTLKRARLAILKFLTVFKQGPHTSTLYWA